MSRVRSRPRRLESGHGELALAAMVDMMINLLIFLLHLYGNTPVQVQSSPDLVLPDSRSHDPMTAAVSVVVSRRGVEVGGHQVVALVDPEGKPHFSDGSLEAGRIPALMKALEDAKAATDAGKEPDAPAEAPALLLQCDKRMPWSVLGAVVKTVGEAGFPKMKFVVNEKSEGAPAAGASGPHH